MNFPETLRQFSIETVQSFLKNGLVLDTDRGLVIAWGETQAHALAKPGLVSFFLPEFSLKESSPWRTFTQVAILTKKERESFAWALEVFLDSIQSPFQASERTWIGKEKSDFEALYEKVQLRFKTSSLKKLVPLLPWISLERMGMLEKGQRILRLLKQLPAGKIYGYWDESSGILGDSPESLFSLSENGKRLQTMAVAGTLDGGQAGALLSHPKLMAEHEWVVKDIVDRVSSLGKVLVAKTKEVPWRSLVHLRTEISIECEHPLVFSELVVRLHPTPALGTYPRLPIPEILSWDFIPRLRYGAPFGFLDNEGNGECLVAIRNVQWNDKGVVLFTGCGLIVESEADAEWKEHQSKFRNVKLNMGFL